VESGAREAAVAHRKAAKVTEFDKRGGQPARVHDTWSDQHVEIFRMSGTTPLLEEPGVGSPVGFTPKRLAAW
jgi:hypothetical protein